MKLFSGDRNGLVVLTEIDFNLVSKIFILHKPANKCGNQNYY